MTLISVSLPAASDQRSAGPERFRMIDCGVEFDHVCTGHHFVQHSQRWWTFSAASSFALLLFGERHFDFDFTQAFNQRLDASRPQRLDQLVGGSFMRIR